LIPFGEDAFLSCGGRDDGTLPPLLRPK